MSIRLYRVREKYECASAISQFVREVHIHVDDIEQYTFIRMVVGDD